MATPFKALLVEGTSGVGKSTLIDALIRRHVDTASARKIRSLVHLAQSHTYGPLATPEDKGTLTADENVLAIGDAQASSEQRSGDRNQAGCSVRLLD